MRVRVVTGSAMKHENVLSHDLRLHEGLDDFLEGGLGAVEEHEPDHHRRTEFVVEALPELARDKRRVTSKGMWREARDVPVLLRVEGV